MEVKTVSLKPRSDISRTFSCHSFQEKRGLELIVCIFILIFLSPSNLFDQVFLLLSGSGFRVSSVCVTSCTWPCSLDDIWTSHTTCRLSSYCVVWRGTLVVRRKWTSKNWLRSSSNVCRRSVYNVAIFLRVVHTHKRTHSLTRSAPPPPPSFYLSISLQSSFRTFSFLSLMSLSSLLSTLHCEL